MTVDDRFPARRQHSWSTSRPGYRPNSGLSAQTCTTYGALVELAYRLIHDDWHERQATP